MRIMPALALAIAAVALRGGLPVSAETPTEASTVPGSSDASPRLEPYGLAANGSLVFAKDGDLYAADATGNNATLIVAGPEQDSAPEFSHGGTRIAFLREEGGQHPRLMVANADGSNVVAVADDTDLFDWSPDDSQLLVNHDVGGRPWVSVVEADGSGDPRPLDLGGIRPEDGWAAWRPTTGSEVILTGHPTTGSSDMGLYAIHPDGTGLRTIGAISPNVADPENLFQEPQLSLDGSLVGYSNWEQSDAGVLDGYLHVRDLDSGVDHRVQVRPQPEAEIVPVFSPDGVTLAVEAQSETVELSELVVAPLDGSKPGIAIGPTFSYRQERAYAFSPDGSKMVLVIDGATSLIDIATGVTTALPGIPSLPTWQRMPAS